MINSASTLIAGMTIGYFLQKNGLPYSETDLGLQVSIPVGLSGLEYLIKRYVKKQENVETSVFAATTAVGIAIFNGGNHTGRLLARLF